METIIENRQALQKLLTGVNDTPVNRKWLRRVYSQACRQMGTLTFSYDSDKNVVTISWEIIPTVKRVYKFGLPTIHEKSFNFDFNNSSLFFEKTGYAIGLANITQYYSKTVILLSTNEAIIRYMTSGAQLIANIRSGKYDNVIDVTTERGLFDKIYHNTNYLIEPPFSEFRNNVKICIKDIYCFKKGQIVDVYYQSFGYGLHRRKASEILENTSAKYSYSHNYACDLTLMTRKELDECYYNLSGEQKGYVVHAYNVYKKYMDLLELP